MTKTTYTAVTRNRNSWTQYSDGSVEHQITWDCGHKHRSYEAAGKCLEKMGNAACSFRANIENSNGEICGPDGLPY